jgi:glucose-1-phosphatase
MEIRNIIFDLGGVLLNLDYQATIDQFKQLGVKNFDHFFTQAEQVHLFDRFDKGEISVEDFREELRQLSGVPMSDEEIDDAWNAMILDVPQQQLPLLELVRDHYRIFLLSNTNAIHIPFFFNYLRVAHGYESMEQIFEKQYLSFEIGMRKPDLDIFDYVLRENGLNPSETLFIDDTRGHVNGSLRAGIVGYWLDLKQEAVHNLFENGRLKDSFLSKLQNSARQSDQ